MGHCVSKQVRQMSGQSDGSSTHTLRPGESSVYSLSMVFDEPPAPAARVELGFETVLPVARRLTRKVVQFSSSSHAAPR